MAPFHFKNAERRKDSLFLSEIYSLKGDILTGNEVMVRILCVSIKIMRILYYIISFCSKWSGEENHFCPF